MWGKVRRSATQTPFGPIIPQHPASAPPQTPKPPHPRALSTENQLIKPSSNLSVIVLIISVFLPLIAGLENRKKKKHYNSWCQDSVFVCFLFPTAEPCASHHLWLKNMRPCLAGHWVETLQQSIVWNLLSLSHFRLSLSFTRALKTNKKNFSLFFACWKEIIRCFMFRVKGTFLIFIFHWISAPKSLL